ncbi:hypothetical protein, conserved [Eimeria tenella]|uniref:Uncharacterized protein n=1 Tax=Eimeria tenella TaxID=5802 RepID=U6KR06_EIMTE|nr:hypothetical protein, conserved [Eimeria tenella]CDJ40537.1 hypothetical protein, conserved [Eimeria tenella]|eukprot:XP_013231287.1 hypothetical protein, conserved [Eimeria tenella]
MNSTPPVKGPSQQQQQQMLLLQQRQQSAQQQMSQQVLQQAMTQQQHTVLSPQGQHVPLQQSVLQHPQQLLAQQQQQPQLQQQLQQHMLQQQQQARLGSLHGISPHSFPLPSQPMPMQHLQQQQYIQRPPIQQQLTQQPSMQLQQHLQHQQQLQLQPQHTLPSSQRHFLQKQHQLYGGQQQLSHHQQQGSLQQPPQLSHQQLQSQQLQQQQLQHLHGQNPLLQQQHAQHTDTASLPHMGTPKSTGINSTAAGPGLMGAQPLSQRSFPGRVNPHGIPKNPPSPSTIILAAAPMEAVQIAARPGSSSTVADLVREVMEAAETADQEADSHGAARATDEGFSVHDLLDFTEDVAAIMEAFLSPDMAVAAEALELTVQLALDFVDDLVEKGVEHRRQQQEGMRRPRGSRHCQPQLLAEDLLAGLRSNPRKALRCKEALENYRQLEALKLAFPEDRYLSAPTQGHDVVPVSPQGGNTASGQQPSAPNPPPVQSTSQDAATVAPSHGHISPLDPLAARQRSVASPHTDDCQSLTPQSALRTQQHDAAFGSRPAVTPSSPNILPLST